MQALLDACRTRPLSAAAALLLGPPALLLGWPIVAAVAFLAAPFLVPALLFVGVRQRLPGRQRRPHALLAQPLRPTGRHRIYIAIAAPVAGPLVAERWRRVPRAAAASHRCAAAYEPVALPARGPARRLATRLATP